MAFCGQCGFKNPDDAMFCGRCGATLTPAPAEPAETVPETAEPILTEPKLTEPVLTEPVVTEPTPSESAVEEPAAMEPAPTEPAAMEPVITSPSVETTPAQPAAPPLTAPAAPPTAPPVPSKQQAPPTPPTPPAPPVPPVPPASPKKKSGGMSKTCLGCGCAAVLAFLLALGGLGWWGYSYMKEHNMTIDEVLTWFGKGNSDSKKDKPQGNGNSTLSNNGDEGNGLSEGDSIKGGEGNENEEIDPEDIIPVSGGNTAKQLAEEMHFPVVTTNALPKNDMYYRDKAGEFAVKFKLTKKRGSSSIGTMELIHWESGENFTFQVDACGNSIYRLTSSEDDDMNGYLFIYSGGKRLLMGDKKETMELTLS